MSRMTKNGRYSITTANDKLLKIRKVKDLLVDEHTILQNELKSLLESNIEDADPVRINQIISLLLNEFETSSRDNLTENSLKSLTHNWAKFSKWCVENELRSLPCSVAHFEKYLIENAKKVKFNTLKILSWAVQTFHVAVGLPSPTHSLKISKLLIKIDREKAATGESTKQAPAFNVMHLNSLKKLYENSHSLKELRDLAFLTMAYETMLRESELARATFEQISYARDGRGILLVPITKTRHSGEPDKIMLSLECLDAIDAYVAKSGIERSGYIFRRVHRSNKIGVQVKPLSGTAVDDIFSHAFKDVTDNGQHLVRGMAVWSGHSARVGACQDLLSAGYTPLEVQVSGRWSTSAMVYLYGRDILAEDSAMAKFRNKKSR